MSNYLVEHQSRTVDPTPYEVKLAGAIEEVFAGGAHELDSLVEALNHLGIPNPNGEPWTAETFTSEMQRMGA